MNDLRSILIVEDDEDDFFFTQRALRKFTLAPIFHLEGGYAAINYLAGNGSYADREAFPFPDLMFVDLKMDAGNGHEVLAWVQANLVERRPRVFVLTGSNEPRDRELTRGSGVTEGYLVKPLTPEHLTSIFGAPTLRR